MMSDPINNNNSQTNLANNGSYLQRSTTDTNSAINNNDTNFPIISQLNPIVSIPDNFNINNNNSNINDKFSSLDSSPCLSDHSNTISIASLNVRGINNNTNFDAILEDQLDRSFSIIVLQETKITEARDTSHFIDLTTRNRTASTLQNYGTS